MTVESKPRIVFFVPRKDKAGGFQILFARLIEKFCEDKSNEILVIDYEDGYISKYFGSYKINILNYDVNKKQELLANDILITSLSFLERANNYFKFHESTRLFFWDLGSLSMIQSNMIMGNFYKKLNLKKAKIISNWLENKRKVRIRDFFYQATDNFGLVFMCGSNFYFNSSFFNTSITPKFLPIPIVTRAISEKKNWPDPRKINNNKINVGWLSRLTKNKTAPLLKLLNDLNQYRTKNGNLKIEIHILGNGTEEENIRKLAEQLGLATIFTGRIERDKVEKYIKKNIDLGFAMGTSALELGKNGIPTVLTTGEKTLNNDDKLKSNYKWLFDSNDYNLSSHPSLSQKENLKSIDAILDEFYYNYIEYGNTCYSYVIKNHNINTIYKKLKEYLNLNTLTYRKFLAIDIYKKDSISNLLIHYNNFKRLFK